MSVKISILARINSFFKNNKKITGFIGARLIDVGYWLFIYFILSFVLKQYTWQILLISVSIYFLYKEVIADIIKIRIVGGNK